MTQDIGRPLEVRQEAASWTAGDVGPLRETQVAEFELANADVQLRATVRVTPVGILAVGALVTGIILATSSLVWSATSIARSRADRRG